MEFAAKEKRHPNGGVLIFSKNPPRPRIADGANAYLEPDLSDSVVLNAAPLRELVRWKEAKQYWVELMEGKYECSSIGKQLRQKGLVCNAQWNN
jgi:hypothetical protein